MISSADTDAAPVVVEVVEAAAPLKAEKVAAKVDVAKIKAETIITVRPRLVRVRAAGEAGEVAILVPAFYSLILLANTYHVLDGLERVFELNSIPLTYVKKIRTDV